MSEQPIKFCFNAKKAAQVANKLLGLSGGRRDYMELVKLLYLVDREALLRLDCSITGDQFVVLPRGLVLSRILDLIRWGPVDASDEPWFETVSAPIGYDVERRFDCGVDELSSAEQRVITDVFAKYGKNDWKQLSRLTHNLPEWIDPNGGSIPISFEQILMLEGKPQEVIKRIKTESLVAECLDREIAAYEGQEFEVSAIAK